MTEGAGFHAAYGAELAWVWSSLRRLGVPERDLPDASHDVFLVAWQRRASFIEGRPARPWLFGIASRLAANRRVRKSGSETLADQTTEGPSGETPEQALQAKQTLAQVQRGLDALDADKRAVFVGHDIEGLQMPALAEALSIPLNTAYSRLRLARTAFEKAYRGSEVAR